MGKLYEELNTRVSENGNKGHSGQILYVKLLARALPEPGNEYKEAERLGYYLRLLSLNNARNPRRQEFLCVVYNYNWNRFGKQNIRDKISATTSINKIRDSLNKLHRSLIYELERYQVQGQHKNVAESLRKTFYQICDPINLLESETMPNGFKEVTQESLIQYNSTPYGICRNAVLAEGRLIAKKLGVNPLDVYYHFIDDVMEGGLLIPRREYLLEYSPDVHDGIIYGNDWFSNIIQAEMVPRIGVMHSGYQYSVHDRDVIAENDKNRYMRQLFGSDSYPGEYCLLLNGFLVDEYFKQNQEPLFGLGKAEGQMVMSKLLTIVNNRKKTLDLNFAGNSFATFSLCSEVAFVTAPGRHIKGTDLKDVNSQKLSLYNKTNRDIVRLDLDDQTQPLTYLNVLNSADRKLDKKLDKNMRKQLEIKEKDRDDKGKRLSVITKFLDNFLEDEKDSPSPLGVPGKKLRGKNFRMLTHEKLKKAFKDLIMGVPKKSTYNIPAIQQIELENIDGIGLQQLFGGSSYSGLNDNQLILLWTAPYEFMMDYFMDALPDPLPLLSLSYKKMSMLDYNTKVNMVMKYFKDLLNCSEESLRAGIELILEAGSPTKEERTAAALVFLDHIIKLFSFEPSADIRQYLRRRAVLRNLIFNILRANL
ncbi:hypothetical protein IB643_03045 [Allofrancisella guangzhouensis]|uniref:hypothetical protein n=1 Tax=Allofrancisella guangzhouensis TaxID=594679 RepID=UPI0019082AFB|nr:hypothetical protein [Allofrancisella guangzhouensis]MBK2027132.1 hypothetical protein [Allofrancisella guangzhouensis]